MEDTDKEIAIDIGGGWGEYFFRLAKESPQKNFIVLDPRVRPIKRAPNNLFLIKWRTDIDSKLPFLPNKIDEAHINFLLGEINGREEIDFDLEYDENQLKRYKQLLKDFKEVLKSGALVHITDTRDNIIYIQDLLKKEGYNIIQEPKRLPDMNRTKWSKTFIKYVDASGRREEESHALPMEVVARWKREV